MQKEGTRKTYFPALDSLRLLAMLGILAYHYAPHRVSGGFIGVDLFLVISGFLLVKSLMKWEFKDFGRHYLSQLLKRVFRLGIPLVLVFLASVSVINIFFPDLLYNIRGALISSLLYVNNWWQIGLGFSYFEQYVHPSAFTHLWYVSVLMQLSLIWPLLIITLRRMKKSPVFIAIVQVVLAVLSAVLMGLLFAGDGDPSRVYYGTDTRLYAFALGGALGAVWDPKRIMNQRGKGFSFVGGLVSIAGMAGLVYLGLHLQDQSLFTYRGGLFLSAVVSVIVVAGLTLSNGVLQSILGIKPLAFLGKCTYSTYLWYYPVLMMGSMNGFLSAHQWVQWLILLVLSVGTYLLIEKGMVSKLTKGQFPQREDFARWISSIATKASHFIATVLIVALVVSSGIGFARADSGDNETVEEMQAQIAENERKLAEQQALQERNAKADVQDIPYIDRSVMLFCRDLEVTFVGDSILLGAAGSLMEAFPLAIIDGKVGRQLSQSSDIIQGLIDNGQMKDIVVLVLGSNGPFVQEQLDAIIKQLGDREIYLVNTKVPRQWQDEVNKMLADTANKSKKDKIHMVDWFSFISQHPEMLYDDNTHPEQEGCENFTRLIAEAIYDDLASKEQKEKDRIADEAAAEQAKQQEAAANEAAAAEAAPTDDKADAPSAE